MAEDADCAVGLTESCLLLLLLDAVDDTGTAVTDLVEADDEFVVFVVGAGGEEEVLA